jgi:hypothetical protein
MIKIPNLTTLCNDEKPKPDLILFAIKRYTEYGWVIDPDEAYNLAKKPGMPTSYLKEMKQCFIEGAEELKERHEYRKFDEYIDSARAIEVVIRERIGSYDL